LSYFNHPDKITDFPLTYPVINFYISVHFSPKKQGVPLTKENNHFSSRKIRQFFSESPCISYAERAISIFNIMTPLYNNPPKLSLDNLSLLTLKKEKNITKKNKHNKSEEVVTNALNRLKYNHICSYLFTLDNTKHVGSFVLPPNNNNDYIKTVLRNEFTYKYLNLLFFYCLKSSKPTKIKPSFLAKTPNKASENLGLTLSRNEQKYSKNLYLKQDGLNTTS